MKASESKGKAKQKSMYLSYVPCHVSLASMQCVSVSGRSRRTRCNPPLSAAFEDTQGLELATIEHAYAACLIDYDMRGGMS